MAGETTQTRSETTRASKTHSGIPWLASVFPTSGEKADRQLRVEQIEGQHGPSAADTKACSFPFAEPQKTQTAPCHSRCRSTLSIAQGDESIGVESGMADFFLTGRVYGRVWGKICPARTISDPFERGEEDDDVDGPALNHPIISGLQHSICTARGGCYQISGYNSTQRRRRYPRYPQNC
jgi:hypothetical protein